MEILAKCRYFTKLNCQAKKMMEDAAFPKCVHMATYKFKVQYV